MNEAWSDTGILRVAGVGKGAAAAAVNVDESVRGATAAGDAKHSGWAGVGSSRHPGAVREPCNAWPGLDVERKRRGSLAVPFGWET